MVLKGLYAGKPAVIQLLLLLSLLLFGAAFSSLIGTGAFFMLYGEGGNMMDYPGMLRTMQFCSAIGTFLIPALLTAWFCSTTAEDYLYMRQRTNAKVFPLVLLSMILLSPTITLTALMNKQMVLPSFMAPVEAWMQSQEDIAEQLTMTLLSGNDLTTLFSNLIVVALTAGITEELFFRGALQRILGRWISNHHFVIWLTAALFSAFHMQFYGFVPRMLLGAYFGYLLYWSRNIWIPVFAHITNNAIAVVSMSDSRWKDNEFISGDITDTHLPAYTAVAIVALILYVICVRHIRKMAR